MIYKLNMTIVHRILPFFVFITMTILTIYVLFSYDQNKGLFFFIFIIFFFLNVLRGWFLLLSFPIEIHLNPDNTITFVNLRKSNPTFPITELDKIEQKMNSLIFTFVNKKISTYSGYDNFHELIQHIKERNPIVELKGV